MKPTPPTPEERWGVTPDRWRGVTRAEIDASLAFEEEQGRGPDSKASVEMRAAIVREEKRLAEYRKNNPERKAGAWNGPQKERRS